MMSINGGGYNFNDIDLVIVSSRRDFYRRMKLLESQGVPIDKIIDGKVFFRMIDLDFARFLAEGTAYSLFNPRSLSNWDPKYGTIAAIYPRVYKTPNGKITVTIDRKGYIADATFQGRGLLSVGKYCSISWNEMFRLDANGGHNWRNAGTFGDFDWPLPKTFYPPRGVCKILIGNDVWIGRNCIFKCVNPNKPLVIGDGAVIAADSVIVKDIPPYAIVGGNPAQVIKYRFPQHIIESLLRIKWWDWSLDKIYDNYKYFNDIEKFVSLHDKI